MKAARALAVVGVLVPKIVMAHPGLVVAPHDALSSWSAPPFEIALLLLTSAWYGFGVRSLWQHAGRGRGISPAQAGAFAGGVLVLFFALLSPLDAMSEALFSAHMVQHLLLLVVAAPLFVIGAPILPGMWALPLTTRKSVGKWWRKNPAVRSIIHRLTSPSSAFVLQSAALWFWHLPATYQLALRNPAVHAVEHLSFIAAAVLFWWTLIQPVGRRRVSIGGGILMIGGTLAQGAALGALLTFSTTVWYPAHTDGALLWGLSPLKDQQLAGLIMWVPAGLAYLGAAAVLFVRGMNADARQLI